MTKRRLAPEFNIETIANDVLIAQGARNPKGSTYVVQENLQGLGFYLGRLDDIFGPKTKRAVINFQKSQNLDVTGVVDWETLDSILDARMEADQSTAPKRLGGTTTEFNGRANKDERLQKIERWFADQGQRDFVVMDKREGRIHVYIDGQRVHSAPALSGKVRQDLASVETIGKSVDATTDADKITPAGIYSLKFGVSPEYGPQYSMIFPDGYDAAYAVHSVYTGTPSERRIQRLKTPTGADNNISYGCINLLKEDIAKLHEILGENPDRVGAVPMVIMPYDDSLLDDVLRRKQIVATPKTQSQPETVADAFTDFPSSPFSRATVMGGP